MRLLYSPVLIFALALLLFESVDAEESLELGSDIRSTSRPEMLFDHYCGETELVPANIIKALEHDGWERVPLLTVDKYLRGVRKTERLGFQHPEAAFPLMFILGVRGDISLEALRLDKAGLLAEADKIDPDTPFEPRLGQDRSHLIGVKACTLVGYSDNVRSLPERTAQLKADGEALQARFITPFNFDIEGRRNGMINYFFEHPEWKILNISISFDFHEGFGGYYFEIDRSQGVLFGADPDTYRFSDD